MGLFSWVSSFFHRGETVDEFLKREAQNLNNEKEFDLIKEAIALMRENDKNSTKYTLCFESNIDFLIKSLQSMGYLVFYYHKDDQIILSISCDYTRVDAASAIDIVNTVKKKETDALLKEIYEGIKANAIIGKNTYTWNGFMSNTFEVRERAAVILRKEGYKVSNKNYEFEVTWG